MANTLRDNSLYFDDERGEMISHTDEDDAAERVSIDRYSDDEPIIVENYQTRFHQMKQISILLLAASCNFIPGLTIGWSVIVPEMKSDNFNLTSFDVQWIISSGILAIIPGNLSSGVVLPLIGPRTLMIILCFMAAAFWIGLSFSCNLWMLYLFRSLLGYTAGLSSVVSQTLVTELSDPFFRGFASGLPETMVSLGILYSYLVLNFLPWTLATGVLSIPNAITFLFGIFVPESPYWLGGRKGLSAAKDSLTKLFGPERQQLIDATLLDIQASLGASKQSSVMDQVKLLKSPQNWRPILFAFVLFILREAGGETVMFTYAVVIFTATGAPFDPFIGTLGLGLLRIVFTLIGALLMDRLGRRPLLLISATLCALSLGGAGAALLFASSGTYGTWVAVVALYAFVISYALGLGPVPWTLTGELIPTPVRSLGCSVVFAAFGGSAFVASSFFLDLVEIMGLGGVLLAFSGATFVFILVAAIWLPETKGKTLLELEVLFKT